MRLWLIALMICALSTSYSGASQAGDTAPARSQVALSSSDDKVLYAIGMRLAAEIAQFEFNPDEISKIMADAFGDRLTPPKAIERLVEDDRKGRKNGRGFYSYDEGKRTGVDETIYATLGVEPTTKLPMSQIQDRLALQFVTEAVRCLEEGVLRSAQDGDIGAVFGLGFPPFRGGPFTFIDQTGAARMQRKLEKLADQNGERFATPALLAAHAADGDPFRSPQ